MIVCFHASSATVLQGHCVRERGVRCDRGATRRRARTGRGRQFRRGIRSLRDARRDSRAASRSVVRHRGGRRRPRGCRRVRARALRAAFSRRRARQARARAGVLLRRRLSTRASRVRRGIEGAPAGRGPGGDRPLSRRAARAAGAIPSHAVRVRRAGRRLRQQCERRRCAVGHHAARVRPRDRRAAGCGDGVWLRLGGGGRAGNLSGGAGRRAVRLARRQRHVLRQRIRVRPRERLGRRRRELPCREELLRAYVCARRDRRRRLALPLQRRRRLRMAPAALRAIDAVDRAAIRAARLHREQFGCATPTTRPSQRRTGSSGWAGASRC